MDLTNTIHFAQIVNFAYAIDPTDLSTPDGSTINAGGTNYILISSIFANDLATEMNPLRATQIVSIGLILQAVGTGDVVIAIRGTEGIMEWVQDANFLMTPCPFLASAGNTEDGFTEMYSSFRTANTPGASGVVTALATIPFPIPPTSMTICGHSLGGALATLLALDLAANVSLAAFKTPTVYTYASPRTGDSSFTTIYDHVVSNTVRIANRMDLVPKLPLPPLYSHVAGLSELNPVQLFPFPPRILIKPTLACEHILSSYLYLLSFASGGPVLALSAACVP